MAKKKAATKKAAAKKSAASAKKKAVKKKATKKPAAKKTAVKKAAAKKTASKKAAPKKPAAKKATPKKSPAKKTSQAAKTPRKKGVRRATLATGVRSRKSDRKIGRSRIPMDAPLSVVFEHFPDAQKAFEFLGIHTIRELEEFKPDDLVMKLTSPAKQTVGRIRKILAMNNRCLAEDEAFAVEFQEQLASRNLQQ